MDLLHGEREDLVVFFQQNGTVVEGIFLLIGNPVHGDAHLIHKSRMGQIPEIYQPRHDALVDNYIELVDVIVNGYYSQCMREGEHFFHVKFDKSLTVESLPLIFQVVQLPQ